MKGEGAHGRLLDVRVRENVEGMLGRRSWLTGGGLVLALCAGCVVGGDEFSEPPGPPAESEGFEQVVIERPSYPHGEREAFGQDFSRAAAEEQPGEGPCSCETPDCLQEWADLNLGCDVCVSVVCDGEPGAHVCHSCAPADAPH